MFVYWRWLKSVEIQSLKMASLLCDVRFLTSREDIAIRDTDHGVYKYNDKLQMKAAQERPYAQVCLKYIGVSCDSVLFTVFFISQDKMSFALGRGQIIQLDGKRLKASLKELEETMSEQPVIFSAWRNSNYFQVSKKKQLYKKAKWLKNPPLSDGVY